MMRVLPELGGRTLDSVYDASMAGSPVIFEIECRDQRPINSALVYCAWFQRIATLSLESPGKTPLTKNRQDKLMSPSSPNRVVLLPSSQRSGRSSRVACMLAEVSSCPPENRATNSN